jgi:hypothetical protein
VTLLVYNHVRHIMIQIVYLFRNSDSTDRVLEKLIVFQLFEKFSAFYGTPGFITVLTKPSY